MWVAVSQSSFCVLLPKSSSSGQILQILCSSKTDWYLPSGFKNSLNVGKEMNVWDSE